MKKSAKWMILLIVVSLLATMALGCADGDKIDSAPKESPAAGQDKDEDTPKKDNDKPVEKIKVRYVVPGTDFPQQDKAIAAVNQKMAEDGLNLELEIMHIGWDAWDNKTNIMLSTGEEFELFHVMENRLPTGVYASRGAIVPLDDIINEHTPELKGRFTEGIWEAAKVDGKIYTIPAYWRDVTQIGGEIGDITVRKDMLDKLGLDIPKTIDELISTGVALKAEMGENVYMWDHEIKRSPVWLHRAYDSWPFYADFTENIVAVDQEGNVTSWLESEEFKKDCEIYREMYKKGLFHPDILSIPRDTKNKETQEGRFLFGLGTVGLSAYPGLVKKIPDIELEVFRLAPEKQTLLFLPLLNSNAVPSTTKHPEAGVKFLNWLYSERENHDIFLYGIEGEHYEAIGEDRFKPIVDDNNKPFYQFDFWQVGYNKFTKFQPNDLDEHIRRWTTTNEDVIYSPVAGFTFNSEPVKTEYTNLLAEIPTVIYPIKLGVVDYDDHFDAAIKRLKAAGLDKVVEEYQRQLNEYMASKK